MEIAARKYYREYERIPNETVQLHVFRGGRKDYERIILGWQSYETILSFRSIVVTHDD